MYEYDYVRICAEGFVLPEFKDHRETIDRHASDGWRYAGWFPVFSDADTRQIDLIFEREI